MEADVVPVRGHLADTLLPDPNRESSCPRMRHLKIAGHRRLRSSRAQRKSPACWLTGWRGIQPQSSLLAVEVEQVKQVADGWPVDRYIRVALGILRVREVIPAARCQGRDRPVALDELQD